MKTYRLAWAIVVPALGIWVVPLLVLGVATACQGQATTDAGVQVLTRGPVHEAFAEASMTGATAGVVITKAPPDPIAELPPDQRPEGDNVAWIPGYWSWDDDRSDFIWVSGVWRDLPPGRQWVPGYWTAVQGGSQWISGFWGDVAQTEVTYLPPPPEPLEAGPSSPAPRPDTLWTSGCWVWQDTRYAWQPGYWMAQQPDWIWVPAHYTWTPRGYVYVPGYWDHDIVHRGVMFAPVYYDQPIYTRANYYYSPSTVLDLAVILTSLFVQPRSHHYYYGDYYDRRYEEGGYYPWSSTQVTWYGDDPIYAHYRSRQLRQDPDWDVHVDEQYRYRREHVDARPPQTLALQVNIINNQRAGAPENVIIGRSLAEAAQSNTLPLRFTPVNMDERKQIETRGREVNRFQLERKRLETAPAAAAETAQPVRLQLPASPVAARSVEKVEGAKTPPPIPATPKPEAVRGKGRQEKPQKVEAKTETPKTQEKPAKAETTPSRTKEKPQRVQAKPKTITPESRPRKTQATPEPRTREVAPTKAESKARPPQATEKMPRKVEPKPEPKRAAEPKPPEAESGPQKTEPAHESPNPEIKAQGSEPKAQPPRTETKQQKGKRKKAPTTEDNTKKSEEK